VVTSKRISVHSADLREVGSLSIPPPSKPHWSPFNLYISPTGKSVVIKYLDHDVMERSPTPRSRGWRFNGKEEPLQWIDIARLETLALWTDDFLHSWIAVSERNLCSFRQSPGGSWHLALRGIDGPWREFYPRQTGYGGPLSVSDDVVAQTSLSGIRLIHKNGRILFQQEFRGVGPGGVVHPSANGRRLAVGLWKQKGAIYFLDIWGYSELQRIMVMDLPNRWIYALDTRKRKIREIAGPALSPDGSLMAILTGGCVEVYELPATSSRQQ